MHEEYMRQALDLARQAAACGEVPVGCAIVKRRRGGGPGAATAVRSARPPGPMRRWRPWPRCHAAPVGALAACTAAPGT